jgi:predicted RNase H-like nuclease
MADMAVLGVDGCRTGWIGARLDGSDVTWHAYPDATTVLSADADVTAIDIPMGLPDGDRRRACDEAARAALGPARSSVFFAPPRELVAEPAMTHAVALDWLRSRGLGGISAQAYGIVARIRDVDAALDSSMQEQVLEAHPELSFRRMAEVSTMPSKKSAAGVAHRVEALRRALELDVVALLGAVPTGIAVDDALDALACAWTARRWAHNDPDVQVLGDGARDARRLVMRIVT